MSFRLVAHIGAPKTGTTSLQRLLGRNKEAIAEAGIGLMRPGNFRKTDAWKATWSYILGETDRPPRIDPAPFLPESAETLIFSEEGLTQHLMPSRERPGGFSGIDRAADVVEALGADDVRILLTVRRQDAFLISSYSHAVHRQAETASFERWLAEVVDFERLSWARLARRLEARFGEGSVDLRPLEALPELGLFDFARWCFPDLAGIDFVEPRFEAANRSPGRQGLEALRRINAALAGLPGAPVDLAVKLADRLVERVAEDEKFAPDLPDQQRLASLFSQENRDLIERHAPGRAAGFAF